MSEIWCPVIRGDVEVASANHNDRSFEEEPEAEEVWVYKSKFSKDDPSTSSPQYDEPYAPSKDTAGGLKAWEMFLLHEMCGDRYEQIQDGYRKKGNYKKMRSVEEWYDENKPLETFYQLGGENNGRNISTGKADKEVLKLCHSRFMERRYEWFAEHDIKVVPCDYAIHVANPNRPVSCATTHIHQRDYILAKSKTGLWEPNITKALEDAGIERPFPNKKKSRFNNPRITMDNELRELWRDTCIEVVSELGLDVEIPPYNHSEPGAPRKTHKNKAQWLKQQQREDYKQRAELNKQKAELDERESSLDRYADAAENVVETYKELSVNLEKGFDDLKKGKEKLEADKSTLKTEKSKFEENKRDFEAEMITRRQQVDEEIQAKRQKADEELQAKRQEAEQIEQEIQAKSELLRTLKEKVEKLRTIFSDYANRTFLKQFKDKIKNKPVIMDDLGHGLARIRRAADLKTEERIELAKRTFGVASVVVPDEYSEKNPVLP